LLLFLLVFLAGRTPALPPFGLPIGLALREP
jgi:hypothetical protein